MVPWLSVRTHNTEFASLNPAHVTIRMPLARKATGSHLTKSNFLEKDSRALPLVSAKIGSKYVMHRVDWGTMVDPDNLLRAWQNKNIDL